MHTHVQPPHTEGGGGHPCDPILILKLYTKPKGYNPVKQKHYPGVIPIKHQGTITFPRFKCFKIMSCDYRLSHIP